MRSLFPKLVAVGLAVVLAAPALAQRPRGGGGMGGPALLANKSVQDELKLTDDQKDAIKKIADEFRAEARKAREDKDQDAAKAAREKATKAIDKTLKPAQAKRFQQIQLQVAGARALATEKVQKALGLSEKQIDEIKEINKGVRDKGQELRKDAAGDREKLQEVFKQMTELRKKANEKVAKVLTADQQKKWQEMQGTKFDYKPERRRRPD